MKIILPDIKYNKQENSLTINFPGNIASWKSTFIGLASAVIAVVQASSYRGDWVAAIHDRSVQMAIVVAALGWVAKDSNVTGGSKGQPSTPEAVVAANQAPSSTNPPEEKKK